MQKQRLFVDMDGTIAVFTPVDRLETLYEKGYFERLAPIENVIEAVKEIIRDSPDVDVHILSAYLTDSPYAVQEKNVWLDKYLPEIDEKHRVFVPCGCDKKEFVEGGIRDNDFLLDDYTNNLRLWHPPGRGIKLLNGINHTRGSWINDRIRYDKEPTELAANILSVMKGKEHIYDDKPLLSEKKDAITIPSKETITTKEDSVMPVSKNGKLYYTEEQFKKARYDSSALEYARAQGYDLVKKGTYYTLREHDSMVFTDKGTWFWNSHDVKGGAIEFMTIYEHKPFAEAVLTLSGENVHTQKAAPTYERKAPEPVINNENFQLPERNDNHRRAYAYLTKTRGIDEEIVSAMLKQGKLYETKAYHNAAFVFQDKEDKAVGAFLRGTTTIDDEPAFRGMVKNSDRATGCFYLGDKNATVACVFEAAIDAMSYASLQKMSGNTDWSGRYYIASGGTGDGNILAFLQSHPNVDTVILCHDNDKAGEKLAEDLADKLRTMDYNVSRAVPKGKDFNDDLLAIRSTSQEYNQPPQQTLKAESLNAEIIPGSDAQPYPDDINDDFVME